MPASQLGLPPAAQEFALALALARGALCLPFLAENDLSSWAQELEEPSPAPAVLQRTAEAMAAVVVGDPLGAIFACAASDARFARADPRAWDRSVAFESRGHRGAVAYLSAALLSLTFSSPRASPSQWGI